ncbi:MAG: hypothetical protein ACK4Z9_04150 [Thermodesulfovibrionales bacterium]
MKKSLIIALVVATAFVVIGGAVYAHGPWGHGMGYGMNFGGAVNVENMKGFQKETMALRDELITKRMELQNEYNKPQRDYERISTLRKEIVELQTKIQAAAEKYGLPANGRAYSMRNGMMGKGMMGHNCPCPMSW